MEFFEATAHPDQPVDPTTFTGSATMARFDGLSDTPTVNMYRVAFTPGARTAWHTHTGTQVLLIIEGSCRGQKHGEPIWEVGVGGAIRIEAGERHWHGATPDRDMVHLALNIDSKTEWFEKVTEQEYVGLP